MKHRLLILGTLGEFVQLVQKSREKGYYTIVCDGYPDGPARKFADEAYQIPVTDTERIAELCREKEIDGINFHITKWYDETHFYKKIIVEDEALREPLIYTEKVAKFSLGDFTEMFAYQGLQMQEVFGDYAFANYDVKKSPRMLMIAKKVKG